jgi:hypothetical protein
MAKRVTRAQMRRRDRSPSRLPLADLGEFHAVDPGQGDQPLDHHSRCTWFIGAVLAQHTPGNPRQLVGQSRREHVVMQPRRSRREPVPETVLAPLGRPEQQHASGLNQERAQVAVTPLWTCFGLVESGFAAIRPASRTEPD